MQHWAEMGKEDCKDHPYFSIFLSKLTKYSKQHIAVYKKGALRVLSNIYAGFFCENR